MEQETMLKEILHALKIHSEKMDEKFAQIDNRFAQIDKRFEQIDEKFDQVDKRFEQIDKRFDQLERKVDGIRSDLSETQKTTNFLLGKFAHHEEKLLQLTEQQQ
ncbi:hypothetical protein SAMN05216389_101124 [Oceanobacillus limi]|uniref:t-SNARE coiled-coil homology domain-containing protein n=1 Tax=Oceanobacillus limi TaxID=930131 RepID=A0A1H9Y1W1_9BACI|nr:hypothetical protein [Oceanobacillus limi]SES62629.1 hypothetical protein SAMN05216389_101124 [Oceanobacillus limi]